MKHALILIFSLCLCGTAYAAPEVVVPAPPGQGTYAELDGADFTGTITAPEVISPKFSNTDDSIYRFKAQDEFSFVSSLRTSIPIVAYTSDKGSANWTYSRTGTATFEDVDGVVHTAADGVGRFGGTNYNPDTGEHSQVDSNGNIIPTSPAFEGGGLWAFGDSQTNSAGAASWVQPLSTMLSQVINRDYAVGGYTLAQIRTLYFSAASLMENPSVIILQGGANSLTPIDVPTTTEADVLPGMMADMSTMIDDAVGRATTVYVWPIIVFGGYATSWTADREAARVKYNTWVKNYCDITGAVFLDLNPVLESPTTALYLSDRAETGDLQTFTTDGIHFNTIGQRRIAEYIFRVMDRKYLKGLLIELETANVALYSQKFDEADWVATNCTAAAEVEVADPANGAETYSLTATAGSGKVVQSITKADAATCFSFWVKRKTGTGRVFLSYDGGILITPIHVDDNWQRVYVNGGSTILSQSTPEIVYETVTNPAVTIQLETSGDAVYVWGAQVEERQYPTSYIPTTTAATRYKDTLYLTRDLADSFSRNNGTIGLVFTPEWESEEADESDGGQNYIFHEATLQGRWVVKVFEAVRRTGASVANIVEIFTGTSTQLLADDQEIGGVMRGQVIPLFFTWEWETGTAMELKGYSCRNTPTTTAASTDQPMAPSTTTTYFGSTNASARQANGYIRDVYLSISAQPESVITPLSDLINRW